MCECLSVRVVVSTATFYEGCVLCPGLVCGVCVTYVLCVLCDVYVLCACLVCVYVVCTTYGLCPLCDMCVGACRVRVSCVCVCCVCDVHVVCVV